MLLKYKIKIKMQVEEQSRRMKRVRVKGQRRRKMLVGVYKVILIKHRVRNKLLHKRRFRGVLIYLLKSQKITRTVRQKRKRRRPPLTRLLLS